MNIVCKSATNIVCAESVNNTFFKKIKQNSNIKHNECLGLEICAKGKQPLEALLFTPYLISIPSLSFWVINFAEVQYSSVLFLGMFAKLWKVTMSFAMPVCLCIHMEQLGFQPVHVKQLGFQPTAFS